jgi:nucleotide-binding universal stress UspA family protein
MFRTALVMLALDPRDPPVLDAIAAAAGRLGVESLLIVHVEPRDELPDELAAGLTTLNVQRPEALDVAVTRMEAALPGVAVRALHRAGRPVDVLEDLIQEEDVDLLVIGRNPSDGVNSAWGPNGKKLMRAVTCSAFVVPVGTLWRGDHAVVGLDFSQNSTDALKVATRIADRVTCLYQYNLDSVAPATGSENDFEVQLTKNVLHHFEAAVLPELGDVPRPKLVLANAENASGLLAARADSDLTVVGSRGLSRIATVLLGSTAERIAGISRGPVLVVRRKGESLGVLAGLLHR